LSNFSPLFIDTDAQAQIFLDKHHFTFILAVTIRQRFSFSDGLYFGVGYGVVIATCGKNAPKANAGSINFTVVFLKNIGSSYILTRKIQQNNVSFA
jgi:hypothetical protein